MSTGCAPAWPTTAPSSACSRDAQAGPPNRPHSTRDAAFPRSSPGCSTGGWHLFGSYGNLSHNYTIRVGRGRSPTGPFFDKRGVALTERDPSTGIYGNTIILGTEGGHSNPGHPHVWEEDGTFYLGYDYRDAYDLSFVDRFAIRRLYWVDDWPVVAYTPVELELQVPSGHPAVGESVAVFFRNAGAPASVRRWTT